MIPPVFISHAVPWLLTRESGLAAALTSAAETGSDVDAVLVANSHWQTDHPTFGVFANGDHRQLDLAKSAAAALEEAGLEASVEVVSASAFDSSHSVWVPLALMFGDRLPPVVTLSVQPTLGAAHHVRVGEALRPVIGHTLLVGSGSLTHNMAEVRPEYLSGRYVEWAQTFSTWMTRRIATGDIDALINYRRLAPHAARSHPQEDHLLPLFVALGASQGRRGKPLYDGIAMGTVSLTAYSFY